MSLVFVDTETTGLDPTRHELWEIAVIEEDGTEYEWRMPPNLAKADPGALRVNHYYDRIEAVRQELRKSRAVTLADAEYKFFDGRTARVIAGEVAVLLANKQIVGSVPDFDAAFLAPFLRANGQAPAWHYHLVDVETLAAGWLGLAPPWDSDEITKRLGIESPEGLKHTALGDARWAKAIYDRVLGLERWATGLPPALP